MCASSPACGWACHPGSPWGRVGRAFHSWSSAEELLGGSPARLPPSSPAPPLLLSGLWRVSRISQPCMCVHVLTLSWKKDFVAEHQRQRSGCPVHVPRVCATARGEWWGHGVGRLLLIGILRGGQLLAFICPS